jgi:hypothetical protein
MEKEQNALISVLEGYQFLMTTIVEPIIRDVGAFRRISSDLEATMTTVINMQPNLSLLGTIAAQEKAKVQFLAERVKKVEDTVTKIAEEARKPIPSKPAPIPRPVKRPTTSTHKTTSTTTSTTVPKRKKREKPDWLVQMLGGHDSSDSTSTSSESSVSEEFYNSYRG